MSDGNDVPDPLKDQIDAYLDGLLDETGTRELEGLLLGDADARRYFVRYTHLHTNLNLDARARRAGERALSTINRSTRGGEEPRPTGVVTVRGPWHFLRRVLRPQPLIAASVLLLAVLAGAWLAGRPATIADVERDSSVAWLVNAQNCLWSDGEDFVGGLRAGKVLKLERGLAQVHFQGGARVVLEGPASLELLSGKSARLLRGKLTARVVGPEAGFEVLSPQGKVIDRGTEFGVSVSDSGVTDVYVFEGKVEAQPAENGRPQASAVNVGENQAARIAAGKVTFKPVQPVAEAEQYVRAIVPPPVIAKREVRLVFDQAAEGGLCDANGRPTGLTHRLPGTGFRLEERDPNLRLDLARAQLELTTTNSDINTQHRLSNGEYLGVRLTDLGFTGGEDFAVTVMIPNIPALEWIGQFGLYAGTASNKNIRGGLISRREPGEYTQFLVNNNGGNDTNTGKVGLLSPGTDSRLTLSRTGGHYSLAVENLNTGSTSSLTIRHPDFLDGERDLYVGLFAANPRSQVHKDIVVKEFQATVWTTSKTGVSKPN